MSVAGIAAISSLAGHESSGKQESEFQKAGQNLQTQELQDAQRAANGLDTLLSGIGREQQLLTDVSTLSRHLQQGDLAAARAAYQAVRHDVQQQRTQSAVEARAGAGSLPPGTVRLGANQAQQGEAGKTEAGTPGHAPPASTSVRQSIDISA